MTIQALLHVEGVARPSLDAPFFMTVLDARHACDKQWWLTVLQDGQSGRLGEATAGLHGLISLHLEAWGCPPHW